MIDNLLNLDGKIALVTGGSRGIGFSIATILAEHGASIIIASLHGEGARKAAEKIAESTGAKCLGIEMDVSSGESVKLAFAGVKEKFGNLDILVNNAGIAKNSDFADLEEDDWDRVLDTNLKGTYLCCRAFVPLMTGDSCSIVNVASISGSMVNVPQYQANYNASKAGVIQLTRSLAVELAAKSIRVNTVSPGYTNTDMNRRSEVQDMIKVWLGRTPMKRLAEVEEVAGSVLFLVSKMAGFVTGHDLVVDGGITILC